jgi:phosphatidylserine decarboxylase
MSAAWVAGLQRLLPQKLLCAIVYRAARSSVPWLKTPLIRWFARRFDVDLTDAERSNADDYLSLNDFFTRTLKPDSRPVDEDPLSVVSPVDGQLTAFGRIDGDTLLQAKGRHYSVHELLGESKQSAAFANGRFATLYLAPHNYHRIHAPLPGRLTRTRYLPGTRYAVNRATVLGVDGLFRRNERAVCWFETDAGPLAVVLVGALNVSSITTVALGEIPSGTPAHWRHAPGLDFAKGAEIGCFNLGSTVIMLFADAAVEWLSGLADGDPVVMGRRIATIRAR